APAVCAAAATFAGSSGCAGVVPLLPAAFACSPVVSVSAFAGMAAWSALAGVAAAGGAAGVSVA
ncbi:hypothetical protein Q6245_29380, partial [Klebsiella pneumoniae]|uniref:hypothetical protein n=1 Tax=Klebsiella pneumoniae TaxID=573 RepID=UPI002730C245